MTRAVRSAPDVSRSHYSYEHYANRDVAEGFDELRFGGPIGELVAADQRDILVRALEPVAGRTILDVGTGTGRAAVMLAALGARVVGLDASAEMVRVARRRAEGSARPPSFGLADAQHLPLPDGAVDAVVCLRLLMHVPDWERSVAEFCRVARWRVVVDYPSSHSLAALESATRRLALMFGRRVEAYRAMSGRQVRRTFARHGFRAVSVDRQFVLPIAFHKAINRAGLTRGVERVLAAVGLRRLLGSPVTAVFER